LRRSVRNPVATHPLGVVSSAVLDFAAIVLLPSSYQEDVSWVMYERNYRTFTGKIVGKRCYPTRPPTRLGRLGLPLADSDHPDRERISGGLPKHLRCRPLCG
jgi:hypothetical protein